ncbi:hypothetical protein DAPPUDRAFT_322573 [Daphnia pulex]|uniref:Uncharacterized protein n=1 Tax=Daphnia pulex TaxID=6669 RepID=E9GWF4_DAPPU|nr:hypothetical protein DAPPUDRAFT_322573 [Daphnia pulex]|eukprot:EFX76196.1 hypothetical protein DAPPUDRAFT_322573 [Daphnia pulex]
MGAMTIDGQKGEKFEDYVDSLEDVNASRGYFTVHNARTKMDNFLGRKVMKSKLENRRHISATCGSCGTSTITKSQFTQIASRKQEALNLAYLEFA